MISPTGGNMQANHTQTKPAINLSFDDDKVKKLKSCIHLLKTAYANEKNCEIAINVLECFMFIKLNRAWIHYAIKHKERDESIYCRRGDKEKQVLRDHNGMAFHIVNYHDPEIALRDYQNVIEGLESGFDKIKDHPEMIKGMINKFVDSPVGCMEARLADVLNYLSDPTIRDLSTLLQEFDQSQYSDGSNQQALVSFFSAHIGNSFIYNKDSILLSWPFLYEKLVDILCIEKTALIPVNMGGNCLITQYKNWYYFSFSNRALAETTLNLIRMQLPPDLYQQSLRASVIRESNLQRIYYRFRLSLEQLEYYLVATGLPKPKVLKGELDELIGNLHNSITKQNLDILQSILANYPVLSEFADGNGLRPLHKAVALNNLTLTKILIEEYHTSIDLPTDSTESDKVNTTALGIAVCKDDNNQALINYLFAKGACIQQGKHCMISWAVRHNHLDLLKLLTKQLATSQLIEHFGNLLIIAMLGNQDSIIDYLCEYNESTGKRQTYGANAVFYAIKAGKQQVLRHLANWGANFNAVYQPDVIAHSSQIPSLPATNLTPFTYALQHGNLSCVIELIRIDPKLCPASVNDLLIERCNNQQVKSFMQLLAYIQEIEASLNPAQIDIKPKLIEKRFRLMGRDFNFSKEEKLAAATAVKDVLLNKKSLTTLHCHSACINNGRLSMIYKGLKLPALSSQRSSLATSSSTLHQL